MFLVEQVGCNVLGYFEGVCQPLAVVQLSEDLNRARRTYRSTERFPLGFAS